MKKLLLAFLLIMLFGSGCALFHAHPDEYVTAIKVGQDTSLALTKNIGRIAANNVKLVSNDTQKLVDAGKMSPEDREVAIEAVASQGIKTVEQVRFIVLLIDLALMEATNNSLSEEDLKQFAASVKNIAKELSKEELAKFTEDVKDALNLDK